MNRKSVARLASVTCVVVVLGTVLQAQQSRTAAKQTKDAVLTGRIVDLHGAISDQHESQNRAESTRKRLRAGMMPALDTGDGLVILGHGTKNPQKLLVPLAYETVEVRGTLYELKGLRYLDMKMPPREAEVGRPSSRGGAVPRGDTDEPEDQTDDDDEADEPAPEPAESGACCVGAGECDQMTQDECSDQGGEFYEGQTCDDVECP